MYTIEEYIAMRKKKDKRNEFDFNKHSENMGAVIQYVTDYFNEYLNIEDYSQEQMKVQQVIDRFKKGLMERYPTSQEFIIDYYWKNRKRLDTYVEKAYGELEDSELFYELEDYQEIAEYVCTKKLNVEMTDELIEKLKIIAKEYQMNSSEAPTNADMKDLDNSIVDWVKVTYKEYRVNLLNYASYISSNFSETYIKTIYDRTEELFYHINEYEYRYQENPFDITDIYERNQHRVFIQGHKGELEMLIMYVWLFEEVNDQDYWSEYINLCVTNQRVKLIRHKRILVPVNVKNLEYPRDIKSEINHIETKNGVLKEDPGGQYVLQLVYDKGDDTVWKSQEALEKVVKNLQKSFKMYGPPQLLEFISPYCSSYFSKEDFFKQYSILEKGMRRYPKLKLAVINGYMKGSKGKEYMFSTIQDLIQLRNTCREMKLKLKLAVDFTDSNGKNVLKKDIRTMVNTLSEMRSFIIAVHINNINNWQGYRDIYYMGKDKHRYMGIRGGESLSDFLRGLGQILQDSRERYLIPSTMKSSENLTELVDILLRGGCHLKSGVARYEE